MEINFSSRECNIKIVYYGPGLSGKTTNLEVIHERTPQDNRGKLTALATDQDRTLFFDYMPLEIGEISGLKIRLRLFTVPGQVYYNSTRKLVLRCVDGVVFVADSQESKSEENLESLANLIENLMENNVSIEEIPLVLQYNKRDLPNIMSLEMMDAVLNQKLKVPSFPAAAIKGDGVFQCLRSIANLAVKRVEDSIKNRSKGKKAKVRTQEKKTAQALPFVPPKKKAAEGPSRKRFSLGQSFAKAQGNAAERVGRVTPPLGEKRASITPKEGQRKIEITPPTGQRAKGITSQMSAVQSTNEGPKFSLGRKKEPGKTRFGMTPATGLPIKKEKTGKIKFSPAATPSTGVTPISKTPVDGPRFSFHKKQSPAKTPALGKPSMPLFQGKMSGKKSGGIPSFSHGIKKTTYKPQFTFQQHPEEEEKEKKTR